jgi:copper chaperone CopZ
MKKIKQNKATLWMTSLIICFVVGISTEGIARTPTDFQTKKQDSLVYVKIEVDGMACPFCAYGLEKQLKKYDGVADFFVDIDKGYVTFNVPVNKKPTEERLKKTVKEAGFSVKNIEYSNKRFNDQPK